MLRTRYLEVSMYCCKMYCSKMYCSKIWLSAIILIKVSCGIVVATEQFPKEGPSATEITSAPIVESLIESPLVLDDVEHGKLLISAYDPKHFLYPVKIVAIDDWSITEDILTKDLLLVEGDHKLKVIPDFSNLQQQTVFMSNDWQEKQINFKVLKDQEFVVAARILNTEKLDWEVQIYRVKLPIKSDKDLLQSDVSY